RSADMTPTPDDLAFASVAHVVRLVHDRQLSPVELLRIYLDRIERHDGALRAYITVLGDAALEAARRAEAGVMDGGPLAPLHGVPYAAKDQFGTTGVRVTLGPRRLEHPLPRAA